MNYGHVGVLSWLDDSRGTISATKQAALVYTKEAISIEEEDVGGRDLPLFSGQSLLESRSPTTMLENTSKSLSLGECAAHG